MSSRTERFGILAAIALGIVVRLVPIISAQSVVGDGGFILAMVDDIRDSGLGLPAESSYNLLGAPFVYPPAALFVAAAIGEISGASSLDILRWMPLAISVGCLVAFAWLARRALPPVAAIGATLSYALMPSAYGWLLAGGGLTRGAGLLFAILAAGVVARRNDEPRVTTAVAAGVLLGLSALSHPQAAIFGVVACVVLSWRAPLRPWLAQLAIAAGAAVIVVAPWLVWVTATHGLEAVLAAGNRFEPAIGIIRMLNLRFSAAPFMDVVGVVGVVGLVACIWRRDARLPILLLATYLVGAGGGEFLAAVPWALLAGVGVATLVEVGATALAGASPATARAIGLGLAGAALFLGLIGSVGSVVDRSSKLHPLTDDQVAAMRWLSTNTPEDATVLVPTDEVWGYDEISEWLPAFAHRHSIGTVQGSEWLGADGFDAQLANHERILGCANDVASCYAAIDSDAVIFVAKGRLSGPFSPDDCCPALRETLVEAGYEIVYDGPGATIARSGD
ncbi:MAG TPA: hypothetical protein VI277_03580 [Candidatus Limnocylindria bacterium]